MSPQELVIQSLSNIVAEKRQRFEALGMQNVYGVDEAEKMRRSMAYCQAQAELRNAESLLRAEIERQERKKPKEPK